MSNRYIGFARTKPVPMFGLCLDGVAYTFEIDGPEAVVRAWDASGTPITSRAPHAPLEVFYSDAELSRLFESIYCGDCVSDLVAAAMATLARG